MTNPIVIEHNVATGEILEREMTKAEANARAEQEATALAAEETKLATTQIYAQVLDTKISKDMLALSKQFEISNNNLKIAK